MLTGTKIRTGSHLTRVDAAFGGCGSPNHTGCPSFASKPGERQYWLTKMGYDTFMPLETQEDVESEAFVFEVRPKPPPSNAP
eukprot:1189905-Prorocentrum_minimum.AAC.1